MNKYAIIENGLISNILIADGEWPFKEQVVLEIVGDQQAEIGWSIVDGKIIVPDNKKHNYPKSIQISETETQFYFEVGDEIGTHNHRVDNGRHTTKIISGVYKITRGEKESEANVGDVLKFTKTENHSILALFPGSIVNTKY
jgi:hypothetical protein